MTDSAETFMSQMDEGIGKWLEIQTQIDNTNYKTGLLEEGYIRLQKTGDEKINLLIKKQDELGVNIDKQKAIFDAFKKDIDDWDPGTKTLILNIVEKHSSDNENEGNQTPAQRAATGTDVSDFIITPNGVLNTHPDDFIIGTKNPSSMGGTTIIIEGNIYGVDPDQISEALYNRLSEGIRY